jgi:single-stranded-DNA-specific exonuclease
MPGMTAAVDRILNAVDQSQSICIYGDYDADGVTAISILLEALKCLGAKPFHFIPDRFQEGVGLNSDRLRELKEQGVELVITVDTGSRAVPEMEEARRIGLDVIITDHHLPGEVSPPAFALINPKIPGSPYPFSDFCGAGVAYKVVEALDQRRPGLLKLPDFQKIAAIGTIADMVPLRGENRWLVQRGLEALNASGKGPLKTLIRKLGLRGKVTAQDISYKIAPRINAPGRLGDPDTAIAFFGERDQTTLNKLVDIMDGMNLVRQHLERDLEERLSQQISSLEQNKLPAFILLAGKNWHRGILGITACKMLRKFSRPVCVLSYDNQHANGSLRGLPGINLIDALAQIRSLFNSFGGHAEAAGVSLDVTNLPQFKARMNELLAKQVAELDIDPVHIDLELPWRELNTGFFLEMMRLSPFGSGNPAPRFISRNLILESEVQRRGPWLIFDVSDGEIKKRCSFYHPGTLSHVFEKYDSITLLYILMPFREGYQIQVLEMNPA